MDHYQIGVCNPPPHFQKYYTLFTSFLILQAVHLTLSSMALEPGWDCPYDWLKVYDGPSNAHTALAGPLCGSNLVDIPVSSSNEILLEFTSDHSREYAGFQLRWNQLGMYNRFEERLFSDFHIFCHSFFPPNMLF